MEEKTATRVSVIEEDKVKSYYKYYDLEMEPAHDAMYDIVKKGQIYPALALRFEDRNDLFDPEYLDTEVGYCVMEDGTGFLANLTIMPGVTAEMFEWWFAWHGLDDLRYKIWNVEDHYKVETKQKEHIKNKNLTYKERLWNTTYEITENIGMGEEKITINFKNPGDLGFEVSKIGTEECSTIVCGVGHTYGHASKGSIPTVMTHFLREIEGGVELRTRFWIGWTIEDGKEVKGLPDGISIDETVPRNLLLHNIKEYAHLAQILPQIFEEEKDNF